VAAVGVDTGASAEGAGRAEAGWAGGRWVERVVPVVAAAPPHRRRVGAARFNASFNGGIQLWDLEAMRGARGSQYAEAVQLVANGTRRFGATGDQAVYHAATKARAQRAQHTRAPAQPAAGAQAHTPALVAAHAPAPSVASARAPASG